MSTLVRIESTELLDGYALRLTFSDGLVRELDFDPDVPDITGTRQRRA